jgi:HEAT repeat protein
VLAVFPAFEEFIIPRLRAWINDPEMEDTCLRFLYAIGGSSAMELLSKAMESGNPEIRFRAAYILSKRKGSYDIFVEKLKSERPEVKLNALEMSMLDDIEWPSSDKYSAISPVLRDKDEAVRAAALKAMADICTKDGEFCARLIDKNDLAAAAIKK